MNVTNKTEGLEAEPAAPDVIAARESVRQSSLVKENEIGDTRSKARTLGDNPFDDVEPWQEAVDPAVLLTEIARTIGRFITCSPETTTAAALWVAMTWFMECVDVAPLAVITAPEKRCGKTQLLTVMSRMSCRSLTASNISSAALFRSIDAWKPTLFIDEADAFMRENEELRGVINCGHTRDSAFIVRTVGAEYAPKKFNVWGAKAISGIGHLADTLMDRAIVLELRRKLPGEVAERLRHAEQGLWEEMTRKLARFARDKAIIVRASRPTLPDVLNDRAQDNWEPLLQIADVAGGEWPRMARAAAVKLSGEGSQAKTVGVELLSDIQEIFANKKTARISSADLIRALCDDGEKTWGTYNKGFPITPAQIAKRLKEYGIRSNTIRIGITTVKGYLLSQFEDAFSRYLCDVSVNDASAVTPSQGSLHAGFNVTPPLPVTAHAVTGNAGVTLKPSIHAACDVVTADTGSAGELSIEVAL